MKKLLTSLISILTLSFPAFAHAAIAYDTSSYIGSFTGTATVTGTNTILFVEVAGAVNGAIGAISCTYGGVAMTALDSQQTNATERTVYDFYILGVSGSDTITCSTTANAMVEVSYTGVNQSAPNSHATIGSGSATSLSTTVSAATSNDWAVILPYPNGAAGTTAASGVITTLRVFGAAGNAVYDSNGTVPAGSNSVGFTTTASARPMALFGIDITPVAPPVVPSFGILTFFGWF